MSADKLITLITGANQGIGLYAASHFAKAGKYQVLLGARDIAKGEAAIEKLVAEEGVPKEAVEVVEIDVGSDESIAKAAKIVDEKYGRLDILVNNAGIALYTNTREDYAKTFNTNVMGPAITVETFLPLLRKSSLPGGKRIINVSSGMGSQTFSADNDFDFSVKKIGSAPTYRASKAALNTVTICQARELEDEGFVVGGVCPGYCGTALNGYGGPKHARDGALVVLYAAEKPKEFVHAHVTNEETQYPW